MAANHSDSRTGPTYSVGQELQIYDKSKKVFIWGKVEEVGDETIMIKWNDLPDPTEYRIDSVTLKGDIFFE